MKTGCRCFTPPTKDEGGGKEPHPAICTLASPLQCLCLLCLQVTRSYSGARWQNGPSPTPLPEPGVNLQAIGLDSQSNQHCHAQQGLSEPYDRQKERARRQLYVASTICFVFIIGEIVGGYLAHSLAVMTDAAHLLTDFASMLISLFSLWMSSRPATKTMSFGWHRAEILGALLSVLSIWVVTGVLVYLAVQRLVSGDYEIEGGAMLITSGCAVAVNIIMGFTLHHSGHGHGHSHGHSHGTSSKQEEQNPSVRAAFIHVVGDLLQSLGVLVAAYVLYYKPEYKYVDPICTFLFSILVLGTTLTILRDVVLVLMEATPKGVDFTAVRDLLLSVEGVAALHSLHIWALTVAQPVLSVHIAIAQEADAQAVLKEARSRLQGMFHFHTTTIQIEDYSEDMRDCQECQGPSD
ncbi:proton-coupled zinc antiporter SLC30A2 isoform X1 [Notamacropus eugenii]|uniref:proton-coupled zinc antiporter SLC30A2 isoform X1 n=1 Tax=Notamacropus eugenii TaxID=9315 RepID=UPI003B67F54E